MTEHMPGATPGVRRSTRRPGIEEADTNYFDSYSHFAIHKEMLSDKVRQLSQLQCSLSQLLVRVSCLSGSHVFHLAAQADPEIWL